MAERPADKRGFVGRAAELAMLEQAYRSPSSSFIPIYGRRRIGKSELILQFIKGKRSVYHLGKVAPAGLQLRELMQESARALEEPLLASAHSEGWKRALEAVVERAKDEKLVLVLDEFQWTAGASPELPSVLQELWDRHWKKRGRVMLILCGSFIGFMEREVLGSKSPLFGRRTGQIHLQPFGYREAADFHPSWSLADKARAYFICGGVPLYLRAFDASRSIDGNIEHNLLSEFAPLFREPEFLLREELREVESYHAVLHAIAHGNTTTKLIAQVSGLPERSLHYYLEQLASLGYVSRRHPLTGAKDNARLVRFGLEDPLLRFWFRFVFPNRSFVQHMGPARSFTELVKPYLDAYFGARFERLCREALPVIYAKEGVNTSFRVGEYWDKTVQIDVVGSRGDGWTDLGECKWGPVTSVPGVLAEMERKVAAFPNPRNDTIGRRVFVQTLPKSKKSVSWVGPANEGARFYGLGDLY